MEKLDKIVRILTENNYKSMYYHINNLFRDYENQPSLLFVIGSHPKMDWVNLVSALAKSPELTKQLFNFKYYSLNALPEKLFQIRHVVSELVKKDILALQLATNFRNDREIVLDACKHNPLALQFASSDLRNDKEFVMKVLGRRFNTLHYVGESLLSDSQVLRRGMMSEKEWRHERFDSLNTFELIEEILKNRPLMVLKFYHLLEERGLEFRIDSICNNFKIIIEKSPFQIQESILLRNHTNLFNSIENPNVALKFISIGCCEKYRACKDHLLQLTKSKYPHLENLSMETEEEKYILKNHSNGLITCKEELRNDKNFVLRYFQLHSNRKRMISILSIGEALLNDQEILKEYLVTNGIPVDDENNLSSELLMKQIISVYPFSIIRFYKFLKNEIEFNIASFNFQELCRAAPLITDLQFASLFICKNYSFYYKLSDELRKEASLVKLLLFKIGVNIHFEKLPSACYSDREIMTHILTTPSYHYRKESNSICYAVCKAFPFDIDLMKQAVKWHGLTPLAYIHHDLLLNNRDFCDWLMDSRYHPQSYYKYLPIDFVMKCIRKNKVCYKYFGQTFRENRQVIDLAMEMGVPIKEITACQAFSEHLWDSSPDNFVDNLCHPGYQVFLNKDLLRRAIERNSKVFDNIEKWKNYPGCECLSEQDWTDLKKLASAME
ncbi:predicted protein [Naegleria gruberi]|uniref:Predicted protein n=1 Tax=Naegleria gruberi TaxID=5762 RepID=D2VIM0_NAEGR|nr:uncharacterized protein NAEGRDRAFT_58324 [Naegleria gruberi]EFC43378.1 predicted protein [Naegleria gruberi]|eukprot:XP_002676122.1 predicted protein [Naegleria gruberi strain NEG-M]